MTAMERHRERRADRAAWPVRVYRLGEEPGDDLSRETTPAQRLAMMWPLAVEAWADRITHEVEGLSIPFIGRAALVKNKRAAGRAKDLADLEALGEGPRG